MTLTAGLGYALVERENLTLRLAAGPAATREFGGTDSWLYEAMVGAEAEWKIAEKHTIEVRNLFFQACDQFFRFIKQARLLHRYGDDLPVFFHRNGGAPRPLFRDESGSTVQGRGQPPFVRVVRVLFLVRDEMVSYAFELSEEKETP